MRWRALPPSSATRRAATSRRTHIPAAKSSSSSKGVFQDEHGDFPAGSYIRNPPTSRHRPGSAAGCTIMVKHWQFDLVNPTHIRIDMKKISGIPAADRAGVAVTPLFKDAQEDVRLE